MKKRSYKKSNFIPIIAFVFSALFILAGCGSSGGGGGSSRSGTTSVSISMSTPSASASSLVAGRVSSQASAPLAVSYIVIEIAGSDFDTISRKVSVSPGVTVTESFEVLNGNGRTFTAGAYSSSDFHLYEAIPQTVNLSGKSVPISLNMVLVGPESGLIVAMQALEAGDIVTARDKFKYAVDQYNATNSALFADADISDQGQEMANFFYALTRVLAPLFDMATDGVNDGFYDAGDIFDFFKCDTGERDPWNFDMVFDTDDTVPDGFTGMICPGILQVNYPGQEMRNYLDRVMAEVEGAIGNLADGNLSNSFKLIWKEPFNGEYVESDYGDAIFLRAVFKAAMAAYKVVDAYDPNLNLPVGTNIETVNMQNILNDNSSFPNMTGSPSASIFWQGEALNDFDLAVEAIHYEFLPIDPNDPTKPIDPVVWANRDEDQSDDWINLGVSPDEIEGNYRSAKDEIEKARSCYNSGNYAECIVDDNTTDDPSDDTKINLGPYFSGAVNINTLWPSFNGDKPIGFLPSSNLGGLLTLIKGSDPVDLNVDEDDDGNADIFQSNLYYVYGGMLEGSMVFEDACADPVRYYDFALLGTAVTEDNAATFVGAGNFDYYVIKFEPKDLGFFSDLVNPDIYLDAVELLGIEDTHISYLFSGWTNFYSPNIYGADDGVAAWINEDNKCVIVDNWDYQADKVTVYTFQ